jgi:hypothetical protein
MWSSAYRRQLQLFSTYFGNSFLGFGANTLTDNEGPDPNGNASRAERDIDTDRSFWKLVKSDLPYDLLTANI